MNTIISVAVIITLLFAYVLYAVRKRRNPGYTGSASRVLPGLLLSFVVLFSSEMALHSDDSFRLLSDIVLIMIPMYILSMSLWCHDNDTLLLRFTFIIIGLLSAYHILCAVGVLELFTGNLFIIFTDVLVVFMLSFFVWLLWKRLRDVKSVVKSGNVWSFVILCVDVVYLLFPIAIVLIINITYLAFPDTGDWPLHIAVILLILESCALCFRIFDGSAFVLMHEHERVIVESMKISHADASLNTDSRSDMQCRELYERIQNYFETSRPYLDGNLTINDLVKVVYSNKVYISKAICRYTGRNFRQYVNYHRIMFSLDAFRASPELKVAELAEMSGFNTVVTYTMAFRLFMNETPSEWCRKERAKILKPKK